MMLAGSAIAGASILPSKLTAPARADEVTASQGNLRTGWDPHEPGLSPTELRGGTFGQLFSTAVQGQVYAQPVVAGGTVIVATENDWVYGLNAVTGAVAWSRRLGTPWAASATGCTDVAPDVGVTSTPVYDPATGTVYLVSQQVPAGADAYHPEFFMHALDAHTGAEQPDWPLPIHGAPVNDPGRPFNSYAELQRPALLLLGGWVYAAFGSHCDITPYTGYVAGVNTSTRALTLWSDEAGITDNMSGIWQSGGGLMSDGPGRIFLATGNGVSPGPAPGASPPQELGDSVVRLGVQADGSLQAQDFFSPRNAPALDAADEDLGSGGPVGLPFGTAAAPGLLAQAGKDGRIFLLNTGALGGREQGPAATDLVVGQAGPYGGQWGHPASFADTTTVTPANVAGTHDYLYYVGHSDFLRVLKFGVNTAGKAVLADVANSAAPFGFSSGSPVVTSSGTDPSTAVVWEVAASGASGANGSLEAFAGAPSTSCTATRPCSLNPIWSAPIGTAAKFSVPATDSGRVYVGTRDGHVLGFGKSSKAPLTGTAQINFGHVAVGRSATATVALTATTGVTVTGVSTASAASPDPFGTGSATAITNGVSAPVTFPVTLTAGSTLRVPVTMAPLQPGGATGALAVATDSANHPTINVPLTGDGTETGLFPSAGSLAFSTAAKLPTTQSVNITNEGTTAEKVNSVTSPAAPFHASGLPATGATLHAGQSITVSVSYAPATPGTSHSTLVIRGSGRTATIALTGTAAAATSRLTPSARPVDIGSVPLGQQGTVTVDVTNTGNLPAMITSASTLPAPFGAASQVSAGLPVNPGYDFKVPLTFTPDSPGHVTTSYRVSWTDALGAHSLVIPVSGTGVAAAAGQTAVSSPGGGWTLNGSARLSRRSLVLTPAARGRTGSAVYPVPEPGDGLHVSFTAQLSGGTGGDGLTFSMLDAAHAGPRALGGTGAGLGFAGLRGVAVTLNTYKNAGDPSANFVGIATGTSAGHLTYAATATRVPRLRAGRHTVGVSVSGGAMTVTVDGTRYLSTAVTLPPSVLLAFTGATASRTDVQTVSGVSINAGGAAVPPPGGGWSYNGSSGLASSDTRLTPAVRNAAGSVVYPAPVRAAGLRVTFHAQLSGGSGGNGLTLALLNPARSAATSLGHSGAGLGFGGLSGIAVTLVTHRDGRYPARNFIGISGGVRRNGLLTFQTSAKGIPPLRMGTHLVEISVVRKGGMPVLIVTLDGAQVLQHAEPLLAQWGSVRLAFTGGTGSLTDVHTVRDAAISTGG